MRKGLQTTLHPLATSDHDEGKTSGQPDVMDDLLIRQLELAKGDIAKLLVIMGGDQSTVEKI